MKYILPLLFISFMSIADTYERFDLPFKVQHSMSKSIPIKAEIGSQLNFKLDGVDYSDLSISFSHGFHVNTIRDIITIEFDKEASINEPFYITFTGYITGDVTYSAISLTVDEIAFEFLDSSLEIKGVDTISANASNGYLEVNSKADYFSKDEKTLDFTISDRSNQVRYGNYNDTYFMPKLSDDFNYKSQLLKVTVNGVQVPIENDVVYDNSKDYKKYSIDYVYHINSSEWRSVFKVNNELNVAADLKVEVKLTPIVGGNHQYETYAFDYIQMMPNSALNVTLSDILNAGQIDTTKDYHAKIIFYSKTDLSIASQNVSPGGRTVNIVK